MGGETALDRLRNRAELALDRLRGADDAALADARKLVLELRNARLYPEMGRLAEAVSRRDPRDATNRRLYAQCLIEEGRVTAAVDVLQPLARRLPKSDPEFAEATGLLGRAHKQLFFDAQDKSSAPAREALKQAIAVYRRPFEANPTNTWHGVNLAALLTRARRLGLRYAAELKPAEVARRVVEALQATPQDRRDEWFLPTLAEASLGLGDFDAVESTLRKYVADDDAKAFQVFSTLRQFTQVWDIESIDERGRALADMLRARLLSLDGGEVTLGPQALQRLRARPLPPQGQLEAVLGERGPETFRWWKTGLERAAAVCSIRARLGSRVGTGWLVRSGSLQRTPADELLVLTNFHVVNEHGADQGLTADAAEVVFEAIDAQRAYAVESILWSSPPDRHDASLLRLAEPVAGIEPLPIARALPVLETSARVYLIGHPGGRDLAFSFQDNQLLDHEGPPAGTPPIDGVCRVHYGAPTEGGSSGSPVFNATLWQVIALHHLGGKSGVPQLNGKPGAYAANEGISMHSIAAAMAS